MSNAPVEEATNRRNVRNVMGGVRDCGFIGAILGHRTRWLRNCNCCCLDGGSGRGECDHQKKRHEDDSNACTTIEAMDGGYGDEE